MKKKYKLFYKIKLIFCQFFSKKVEYIKLLTLYSITHNLKLPYPIIIDSFRAEDLSTQKEEKIIELFRRLNNEIIFTTTLKEEELGKYDEMNGINHIDYSSHTPSKILSKDYLHEFNNLLSIFNLKQK